MISLISLFIPLSLGWDGEGAGLVHDVWAKPRAWATIVGIGNYTLYKNKVRKGGHCSENMWIAVGCIHFTLC